MRDWPDNDEALLELSSGGRQPVPENFWCLNDAFEGVQVFGGTGSGKSSGSGQALARSFLSSNLGGLVLTAKTDEADSWKKWAADEGRSDDLLFVHPDGEHQFNFLRYEMERPGAGAGLTENLVNLFCSVLESSERKSGHAGGGDAYWQRSLKQLLRNAIDLSALSLGTVDLPSLYRIIASAPVSREEVEMESWKKSSVCAALLDEAERSQKDNEDGSQDLELTRDYWMKEFPGLAPETRSIVVSTFTSMADCFLRGMLRKLFCTGLTFSPEDCFEGKIIILDLPVKEFNELGQFAQVLLKFVWQRAVERRIPVGVSREQAQETIRPVFLYADESQFFVNSYDALFQSTARSSRACTVYLTQNLPTYYAGFGGPNGKHEAESFLANLQTKVFHANGDPITNNWAADSIGKTSQVQLYGGLSEGMAAQQGNQNAGGSMVFEYPVQPAEFTTLATGGPDHRFLVDAIVFQGGRTWLDSEGESINHIRHQFSQVDSAPR